MFISERTRAPARADSRPAVRRAAEPTTWEALRGAYEVARKANSEAINAYGAAEKALWAFKNGARPLAPSPAVLTIATPIIQVIVEGNTHEVGGTPFVLKTKEAILGHFASDDEAAQSSLKALEAWEADQALLDEQCGYAAAQQACKKAEDLHETAAAVESAALHSLLAFVTPDPNHIAFKLSLLDEELRMGVSENLLALVTSLARVAATSTPPVATLVDHRFTVEWADALTEYRALEAAIAGPDHTDEDVSRCLDAEAHLSSTATPTLSALFEKASIYVLNSRGIPGERIERAIDHLSTGDGDERSLAACLRDLKRFAQLSEPFNAVQWIADYRANGGGVEIDDNGCWTSFPGHDASDEQRCRHLELLELRALPGRHEAVVAALRAERLSRPTLIAAE